MAVPSFFSRFRTGLTPDTMVSTLATGLFFFLLLCPLIGLSFDLLHAFMTGSADLAAPLVLSPRRTGLLVASIGLAAAVAGAGVILGVLFVSALIRLPGKLLCGILFLLLALAGIPPYIHALTWSEVMQVAGAALPGLPTTGWLISFWVELMALLPLSVFLTWIAFASIDIRLVDAGRLVRSDISILRHIIIPLAAPALGAAFGFVFLICCTDFSVPSLFGADVYALDIFAQFSASNSAAQAFLYALPLLLVTLIVMIACRSGIRTLAQTPNWFSARFGNPPVFPRWFRFLQTTAAIIVGVQIFVLFFGLMLAVGSPDTFITSIRMAQNELVYSLLTAVLVIFISLPLALAAAQELKKPGIRGATAWIIVLVPLAVPAPLIGIGMITLGNLPVLSAIYPALLMPALVSVIKFAPFAAIILFIQMRFIDPLLLDAAAVFARSRTDALTRIHLPLFAPGLVVSAGILAALTLAELGATLIVAPPGHATITMRIYNYLHYGSSSDVAGLCLMVTLLTLVVCSGTMLALRFISRNPAPPDGESIV
ncbi:MAG: iron ABC transporter permease [Methanoregulaceae archaeon]|nr:MAG: iron ABC transporter permease [Methanoregulaceae archaeon]